MVAAIEELKQYIQDGYGPDGVEVLSQGQRSLTVELPIEFHDIGALCAGVENEWDARIDIVAARKSGLGPSLDIWLPINVAGASKNVRRKTNSWWIVKYGVGLLPIALTATWGLIYTGHLNVSSVNWSHYQ